MSIRLRSRRALVIAGALVLLIPFPPPEGGRDVVPALAAQAGDEPGLEALFTAARGVARDSNGDGIADVVAARVIVPATPSAEDAEAATNLAARLAFESVGLTLPVVLRDDQVGDAKAIALPILVGRENTFVKTLVERGAIDLTPLGAGQGLVASVRAPLGGGDGVVVVGGDDEGTLAAGVELAARLPRVWSASGIALSGVADQLARYLKGNGVAAGGVSIESLIVDRDRRGLLAVNVRAAVPQGETARSVKLLGDLDLAHRHGQEARTLNFANVAETRVAIAARAQTPDRAVVRRAGLNARTLTPPIDPDELAPDSPGERGRAAEGPQVAAKSFDLSSVYSIDGWLGDNYADLIPDRTDTTLVLPDKGHAIGAAHVAARLGLESTGVTLPLTRRDAQVREPSREPNPILFGRANALVEQLVKIGRARLDDLQAGDGVIQIVPRAFGAATATMVAGADEAGADAAALHLARRLPYLWDTSRGAPSLQDVKTDATRFFQVRSGGAQAGLALAELETTLKPLAGKPIESFEAKLFLEAADPQVAGFFATLVRQTLPGAKVDVTSQGITDPVPVFEETIQVPWEVDEFWSRFRADILPKVAAGAKVDVEARLSESPKVRQEIADQVRADLTKAGASASHVRVLSAYKQGFLWLTEEVMPALKGKGARSIRVAVAAYRPDFSKKHKFYQVPTRWLHELYPVDDVFQRELGIPREAFGLELVDKGSDPIYTLDALDAAGKVVHHATFSPKFVEREYLEKFPGWARVDVTTGWLTATVNGQTVSDARIATDPERFWDHYQGKVLPRIYDYVMKVTDNRPMPDKQPFHRDLDVEVWMSEPDFRIGLDEELVSSLESLHEDLYFVTLDFFDALGRTTVRRRLAAPGKIFPIMHPDRPGKPGEARILYAGNASTRAKIDITYREKGADKPERVTRELGRIEVGPAVATREIVRPDRVREIELQVEAKDDREAGRAVDALDGLARLQAAGLFKTTLSYEHVDQIAVVVSQKDAQARRAIRATGAFAPSPVRTTRDQPRHPTVTWDHVISPDESEEIVGKLAAYPEVKAYRAGQSYRGRQISIMELTLPTPSELVSLAKLTTVKPTIFITGRQHANEVSSTSHILRLAELLVSDASYRDMLKKVNIVLHPVENPDGAQMAYELQKLTPNHMLHAGRYSALGMDVASQVGQAEPLLPEALVRMRVWRDWLPDIYLNPHGYPAHEWVQQFAGYVPPGFRTYLSSRGWYTSVSALRDPRYPQHARAVDAIRDAIVREINSNADVRAMNLRHQARYRRWAYGFQPFVYNQEIYKDTAIYYSDPETGEPSGSRRAGATRSGGGEGGGAAGGGRFSMNAWPQVTYFNGGTEAPDETAQGAWLDLVTKPGFSYLMASIKYLRDGQYEIERIEEDGQRDSVSLTLFRARPVMPGRGAAATTTNGK